LDESGRNSGSQADFTPGCNVFARVFVLVVAVLVGANLHVGSARAAGEPVPTDLSAQVDGIVSSALGAAQQEPAQAQETANTIVDQALTLARTAAADARATAAPLAAQSVDAEPAISAVVPEASSEIGTPERTPPPGRPRHARVKKRPHAPVSHSTPRTVAGGFGYDGSADTISPSPARPSPAAAPRPAKASPRPERSAPPQPPRFPGPLPPRPDASSSGQAGGQNAPVPLLFATLLGVLAVFALRFLPRLLPLLAFRKPRRIVLPSWHPG
jgi:hypothetical protein